MDEYKFGECIYCKLDNKPLKNGACVDCNQKVELPDFFKDLFNKGEDNDN